MASVLLLLTTLTFITFVTSLGTLTASLDYGTFQGAYSKQYNVTYWQKIPYAAPPTGQNRFRAPQPPTPITNGAIYNSSQPFDMCPQRTVNGSEDCLYLGLYSRPWTHGQPLRPVVVTYYGGAFIQGSASLKIPPSAYPILNVSANTDLIFVYTNYRLNAFGFLPGREIAEDEVSDFNVGLLDQQAALRWTKKYIRHFGGDRNDVTVWGQSAGAGSVVAQVLANGGNTQPKLFSRAMASSPFWPKTYRYDSPEAQAIYDRLAELTGCAGKDSLRCLKEVDVQTIRNASLAISASHTYNTSSYTWAPVVDGDFLREPLSEATARGNVNSGDLFGMYNLHEGENFVPPGFMNATGAGGFDSSAASFARWLRGFLPDLQTEDLNRVGELYPESGTAEELTYNTTYTRAGLIYRDVVLACPALWIANASHNASYLGEYTIDPAKHGSDTIFWNQINPYQEEEPVIYKGYAGALASFFRSGDPNMDKLTGDEEADVPELKKTEQQFVVKQSGFERGWIEMLEKRCGFWRELGDRVPI